MGNAAATPAPLGPPYASPYSELGGLPSKPVDVPIASVFLAFYVIGAASNFAIFKLNMRKGHKFFLSMFCFGYCMARISSMSLRIAWSFYPYNIRVALAANIFIAVGILALYVVNLFFTQRIVRSAHPIVGWSKPFFAGFVLLLVLIPVSLVMLIATGIWSYYTLDSSVHRVAHGIQLATSTYFLFLAFLPLPTIALVLLFLRPRRLETFGAGSWRVKVILLTITSCLLTAGSAWRVVLGYLPPRPLTSPPWYYSKACFWIFDIAIEILVIYIYLIFRADRRFHIPNGSSKSGDYSGRNLGSRPRYDALDLSIDASTSSDTSYCPSTSDLEDWLVPCPSTKDFQDLVLPDKAIYDFNDPHGSWIDDDRASLYTRSATLHSATSFLRDSIYAMDFDSKSNLIAPSRSWTVDESKDWDSRSSSSGNASRKGTRTRAASRSKASDGASDRLAEQSTPRTGPGLGVDESSDSERSIAVATVARHAVLKRPRTPSATPRTGTASPMEQPRLQG